MKAVLFLTFICCSWSAAATIPVLSVNHSGFPTQAVYLGKGDISRAVFSELSSDTDLGIYVFTLAEKHAVKLNVLSPFCENLPAYETKQPIAMILPGEMAWPEEFPIARATLSSFQQQALMVSQSQFQMGTRPQGESGDFKWWAGTEVMKTLDPGLYTLVVWSPSGQIGNYLLTLQGNEMNTASATAAAAHVMPQIKKGTVRRKALAALWICTNADGVFDLRRPARRLSSFAGTHTQRRAGVAGKAHNESRPLSYQGLDANHPTDGIHQLLHEG